MWGAGIYENELVKENGVWKFARLHFYRTWKVYYQGGWAAPSAALLAARQLCLAVRRIRLRAQRESASRGTRSDQNASRTSLVDTWSSSLFSQPMASSTE